MRKIKFRGKRVDNGEWVYGFPIMAKYDDVEAAGIVIQEHNPTTGFRAHAIHNVIPETVGQFVKYVYEFGERTELYEGDIVKFDTEDGQICAVIEYDLATDESQRYSAAFVERFLWDLDEELLDGLGEPCGFLISGNIHDNPELLKQ